MSMKLVVISIKCVQSKLGYQSKRMVQTMRYVIVVVQFVFLPGRILTSSSFCSLHPGPTYICTYIMHSFALVLCLVSEACKSGKR